MHSHWIGRFALTAFTATTIGVAAAQDSRPTLHTNQDYVEEVMRATSLDVNDPMAVFTFVLDSLRDLVKVYPTENYYYFTFIHNGTRYAGNIRLAASDRDEGKVHFSYYKDLSDWSRDEPVNYVLLDASQGVKVEKVDRLVYRLTYKQRSVVFSLNDLSLVKPPAASLGPNERFLGPIFDESAIRFFLVYNTRLKIFHYILDETVEVADDLVPTKSTDRIVIGKRTGFAFYRDRRLDRKILIGVFEGNSRVNNYFDGPFDQLPDNFIEGEALREILLAIDPKLTGQIDRFGMYRDGNRRYAIFPYLTYRTEADLFVFHQCVTTKRIPAASYYDCFVIDDDRKGARRTRRR
jgi:hypothetical protein